MRQRTSQYSRLLVHCFTKKLTFLHLFFFPRGWNYQKSHRGMELSKSFKVYSIIYPVCFLFNFPWGKPTTDGFLYAGILTWRKRTVFHLAMKMVLMKQIQRAVWLSRTGHFVVYSSDDLFDNLHQRIVKLAFNTSTMRARRHVAEPSCFGSCQLQ